jgi:hypothetical protein
MFVVENLYIGSLNYKLVSVEKLGKNINKY